METKGTTTPPPSPIFRIRIFDAVIEVPVEHDNVYGVGEESMIEPDLPQQPLEQSSFIISPDTTDNYTQNSPATTTANEKKDTVPASPTSLRASNFKDDFLTLLTLLPEQRYISSPSSPATSFSSSASASSSSNHEEMDEVTEGRNEKKEEIDSRFTIATSSRTDNTSEEDDTVVPIPDNKLEGGTYNRKTLVIGVV
ncbi:hypothetical protein K445DRAFT_380054 [Daldinia sp. EC12]|nr:hypothetical protein K445DRAFT_380054 [Daldinia sp. EC12]